MSKPRNAQEGALPVVAGNAVASMESEAMSKSKPKGENPYDGSEFGTEIQKPLSDEIVREVTENARDIDPETDDRVVVKEHIDGLGEEHGVLDILRSKVITSSFLFGATHERSLYTPGENRGEGLDDLLRVNLEHRPLTIEGVGETYVRFDIKADPETREIRHFGIHLCYTADTKRRLVKQGRVAL